MKKDSSSAEIVASGIETAWENVAAIFERSCLLGESGHTRSYVAAAL
jgi:hypothetical protein